MSKIRYMRYTKDNGDSSKRSVIIVSRPRTNYLMYDVSELSNEARMTLIEAIKKSDEFRDNALADFQLITDSKVSNLWRSFKPDGIEWLDD